MQICLSQGWAAVCAHVYQGTLSYFRLPITCRGYVLEAHIAGVLQGKLDAVCGVVLQGIANRTASCLCEE